MSADGSTLRFTAEDDGDVAVAGDVVPFAAVIANGWVRADGDGYRRPIAAGGRCVVRRDGATFTVRAVPAEAFCAERGRVDRTALAYDAAALVVLGGVSWSNRRDAGRANGVMRRASRARVTGTIDSCARGLRGRVS